MLLDSICKIGVDAAGRPVGKAQLWCGGRYVEATSVNFDTGASVCHMTYPMWLRMGLNEICWNGNQPLLKSMGISTFEDMDFDRLPFTAKESILGNSTAIKAYEFKLDKLILGRKSIGFPYCIELENITVRLIDARILNFVVGCNVLKHLEVGYKPTENEHTYYYRLTEDGMKSMQHDRDNHISNYYRHTFNYL